VRNRSLRKESHGMGGGRKKGIGGRSSVIGKSPLVLEKKGTYVDPRSLKGSRYVSIGRTPGSGERRSARMRKGASRTCDFRAAKGRACSVKRSHVYTTKTADRHWECDLQADRICKGKLDHSYDWYNNISKNIRGKIRKRGRAKKDQGGPHYSKPWRGRNKCF